VALVQRLWHKEVAELAFVAILKDTMSLPADSLSMGLGGFGEMLPYYENKVTSIITKKTNGQPVLAID
jgi:hypothetical protein